MYSYYDDAPAQIKETELARISRETKIGVYDPLPEIRSNIEHEAREERRKLVTIGLTTGFLGSIGLGTAFSLTAPLIGVIAGGCVLVFAGKGIAQYAQVKKDLKHDQLSPYLSDEELEDLDEFQRAFKPSSKDAKQSHEFIKKLCDELLEDEDSDPIDVKSEEVKDEKGEVNKSDDDLVKEPPLDTSNYIQPVWLDDSKKLREIPTLEELKPTSQMEALRVDLESKQSEDYVELKKGQESIESRLNERLSNFEKAMLKAVEGVGNRNAETTETRNVTRRAAKMAETIGNPSVSAPETIPEMTPETENDFPSETVVHHEKSTIVVGDFDPEKPEKPSEYGTFLSLVLTEDYNPKGAPIVERVWKVQAGGSKRYKAAVVRRDQFASRMSEFGLYGE